MERQTKKKATAKKKEKQPIGIQDFIEMNVEEARDLRGHGQISAYEHAMLKVENTKCIIAYQQLAETEQSNKLLLNISEALWTIAPH